MMKKRLSTVHIFAIWMIAVLLIMGTPAGAATPTLSNSGGGIWEYYKEITISENSDTTLTDYQVLVQLSGSNFPTNTSSDGADIRFVDANGDELSYWIESWDYSGNRAKIWVKVPRLSASTSATINMYYGNPSATSSNNGDATFILFDDFSGTSLNNNKWSTWNFPTYTISNGLITFTSNDDITVHRGLLSLNQFTTDFIIETRGKTYSEKFFPYVGVAIEQHNEANDRRGISTGYYHNEHDIFYNIITECNDADSCAINDINRFEISEQDNDWLLITTKKSDLIVNTRIYNERTKKTYDNSKSIVYSHNEHHLGLSIYRITKTDYDWIFVREYASSEPSVYFDIEQFILASTIAPTPVSTPQPIATPKDTDGDGWSDEQERAAGTNPNKADTDGDGIWDPNDSNPLVPEKDASAPKDTDGDGWSDEQERAAGTNPNKADTDDDGIWDSKDPNPLVPEKDVDVLSKDTDGDGLSDEQENAAGTNPNKADTDDDGIWDSKDPNPLVPEKDVVTENGKDGLFGTIVVQIDDIIGIDLLDIGSIATLSLGVLTIAFSRKWRKQRRNDRLASLKDEYDEELIGEDIYKEM